MTTEAQKEYQRAWYQKNRAKVLAQQAEYRQTNKPKIAARKADWYQENREEIQVRQLEWRRANPDKVAAATAARKQQDPERFRKIARDSYHRHGDANRARTAAYRAANRDYFKVHTANRRKMIAAGDLTLQEWTDILEQFDYKCAYCFTADGDLQLEHAVPLSRGGQHTASNVVPACGPCNQSKFTKTAEEFLLSRKDN